MNKGTCVGVVGILIKKNVSLLLLKFPLTWIKPLVMFANFTLSNDNS